MSSASLGTALVIQHVPFEGPAAIGEWLIGRAYRIETVRLWLDETLTRSDDYRIIVVMGGPMSVKDVQQHPWLSAEIAFLKSAIAAGTPVLGVCLGAQLIATALGCRVYAGQQKEIGWWPVEFNADALPAGLSHGIPARVTAMHWHGETFDLPPGATRFAGSPVTPNQAFLYRNHVVGLQFHLESTHESVAALTGACSHEIGNGTYQVPRAAALKHMLEGAAQYAGSTRPVLTSILDYLLGL